MKSLIVVVLYLLCHCRSARILGIVPVPSHSHYILGHSLMRELAERGHDVTYISCFVDKNPPKGGRYRDITLTGFLEEDEERRQVMLKFDEESMSNFRALLLHNLNQLQFIEQVLSDPKVQELLHSNETFDVVIVEQFLNEALKGFAAHFKTNLIVLSTVGANPWVNLLVGNPAPTSYVAPPFLNYSSHMAFFERTINSLTYLFYETLNHAYVFPKHEKLIKKYFPNVTDDFDIGDVLYNASIVLVNSHPSTNQPVPYVPNMIEIGGFHIKPPQELPTDLKEFLDDAKDGIIYFSLGSGLRSSELPPEKRDAFLQAFSKLKQKVLWKWETDVLPGQPENVKLAKWFPQKDILAHPNVKLFITHGGLLSTTETIYHGVPVLAVPIFGDQKLNARKISESGFGLVLDYQDITEKSLTEILNKLLTETKFTDNAKRRSEIFHDRITSPMDTAIFWVEYVIRHGGAPHLRVAALDLPLYKYFLLDVIFFLLTLALIVVYLSYKLTKKILCISFKTNKKIKEQ